jgi:hypothetical protein
MFAPKYPEKLVVDSMSESLSSLSEQVNKIENKVDVKDLRRRLNTVSEKLSDISNIDINGNENRIAVSQILAEIKKERLEIEKEIDTLLENKGHKL